MLSYENIISSYEVTPNELRVNHTDQYLDSLCHPSEVAKILEMHQIAEMPLAAIEDNILRPMRQILKIIKFLGAISGSISFCESQVFI